MIEATDRRGDGEYADQGASDHFATVERAPRCRFRAREFRNSLKAFVRAGGDLESLARKTQIDLEDLEGLLRGRFHWLSAAAGQALSDQVRVPVVTYYPELGLTTIPTTVVLPYLDSGDEVAGMTARRVFAVRDQASVTPEVAERIVLATAGPSAFYDDPALRRFWFAALPGDTLHVKGRKALRERERRQRRARDLVAA